MTDSLSSSPQSQTTTTLSSEQAPAKQKPTVTQGLINLEKSSKYQALPTEKKLEVRGHLYDKYISPYLKSKGVNVSDPSTKEAWTKAGLGVPVKDLKRPGAPTLREKTQDVLTHYYAGLGKGGTQTVRGIADLNQVVTHAVAKNWPFQVRSLVPYAQKALKEYDRVVDYTKDWADRREDIANSMLGNHYNTNLMTKVAEAPGAVMGFIGKHPAYVVVPETMGTIGASLGLGPLTEKMLEMGPRGKYVYNAVKGAAEGYIISKAERETDKEARRNAKLFVGFELAPPAIRAVARDFGITDALKTSKDGAIKYLSKLLAMGKMRSVGASLDAAAKTSVEEVAQANQNKLSTKLVTAGQQVLDETASKLGYKDFEDAKAKGKVDEVLGATSGLVRQANEEIGLHNPDLIAAQVAQEQKELASNPLGAKLIGMAKKHGVDPVAAATKEVVDNVAAITGANSKDNARKALESVSSNLEDLVRGLGPGAASAKQKEAVDTLVHLVETNIPLQSRANYLTFIWGIRHNIPKEFIPVLKQEMKDIYGHNTELWDQATVKLDQHIDDLITTGHIKPGDPRGVFASTKLVGDPTKWQRQLEQEVEKAKILKAAKEGGEISEAKTEAGKLKMGADTERLSRILGSSLYKERGPKVVTKELLQNAYDATRGMPKGEGLVTLKFNDSYDAAVPSHFTITDNGKGMTPEDIYTVFTDLGSSGKGGEVEASGGFGLAKAAPFIIADELEVSTVGTRPDGSKVKTFFMSTPDSIVKGEVVPIIRDMPPETPTGTSIKARFDKTENLYDARSFARDSQRSINAPAQLKVFQESKFSGTLDITEKFPDADIHVGQIRVPDSADINVYKSTEKDPISKALGMLKVEIHNNGIYQFTRNEFLGGNTQLRGMPSRIIMDIKSTVAEGHPGYPFEANREGLRTQTKDAVERAINEMFINPARKKLKEQIAQIYRNLPTMNLGGGRVAPIFDSGSRLTPEELTKIANNPALKKIVDVFDNIASDMIERLKISPFHKFLDLQPQEFLGSKIERLGIVLSDKVHGVHVKAPEGSKATMFINPLQFHEDATPDQIASLMHHTIKHELIHDLISGHNETFTSAEAKVSHYLGFESEFASMRRIKDAYTDPTTQSIRKELDEALRIYKESRGRAEVTPDLLGGEEITTESKH